MDCIGTAPETARFIFKGGKGGKQPNHLFVNRSVEDGDQKATLFLNRAYLSMNAFTAEYSCQNHTYILFYLTPGNNYY